MMTIMMVEELLHFLISDTNRNLLTYLGGSVRHVCLSDRREGGREGDWKFLTEEIDLGICVCVCVC